LGLLKNIEVVHLRPRNSNWFSIGIEYLFLPLRIWTDYVKAKRAFRTHGPFDGVIVQNGGYPGSWSSFGALRAAKKCAMKTRIHVIHHQAVPRRLLLNNVEGLFDKLVVKWATSTVCVSRATRKTLVDRRGFNLEQTRVRVIHNGINIDSQHNKSENIRAELGLKSSDVLIGVLGRGDQYKGHTTIFDALAECDPSIRRSLQLCVIGEARSEFIGMFQKYANRLNIAENVHFLGYREENSSDIISQLDLTISATRDFEGFGLTIAESMVLGTPVICTDVGAVSEFFNQNCGFMVPPEDSHAMKDSLEFFFLNKEQVTEKALAERNSLNHLSAQVMTRQYENIFAEDSL
jgi:glycosyltransferase involved in cell wall biosynthesis